MPITGTLGRTWAFLLAFDRTTKATKGTKMPMGATRPNIKVYLSIVAVCAVFALTGASLSASLSDGQEHASLKSPSDFAGITDREARSRALFVEAAKVITNPRCVNCHPAGDHPLQSSDEHVHQPEVWRGDAGDGVPGLHCATCHTDRNVNVTGATTYDSIPGSPRWSLAPIEMAWQGKTTHDICEQIKDPARNGGRTLALLHDHMANDDIVAHGWDPGAGRTPAPGSQKVFGELIQAWIDAGAACPSS
jgi:hypothetical protein